MSKFLAVLYLSVIVVVFTSCGGNAANLKEGDKAPEFTAQDAYSKSYTLSAYNGVSPVVLYFYPKANTSGCTKEACGIRDSFSEFKKKNIVVLGMSVDSKEDIREFIDDHNLNFPLLSDEDKRISEKYGVLNNLGVSSRVTFIIDKNGKIAHIMRDVDVETHADEVLEMASGLL